MARAQFMNGLHQRSWSTTQPPTPSWSMQTFERLIPKSISSSFMRWTVWDVSHLAAFSKWNARSQSHITNRVVSRPRRATSTVRNLSPVGTLFS